MLRITPLREMSAVQLPTPPAGDDEAVPTEGVEKKVQNMFHKIDFHALQCFSLAFRQKIWYDSIKGVTRMYNTEIIIRKAELRDAPACAEIHSRGWEAAYAGFIPADLIAQKNAARPAVWPGYLASGRYDYYVPVLEDKVVGFLSLRQPEKEENLLDCYYEVGGIYLHPSVYRRGIGRQLMAFAEERAREKGKTAMILWVFADNAPSRRFYEACGYKPDGTSKTETFGGRALEELRYVKEI